MPYEIDTRSMSYKGGSATAQAHLASPRSKGTFPGVVVIHEWWGLNDWVKGQADELAKLEFLRRTLGG